jgi:hypothetical protein
MDNRNTDQKKAEKALNDDLSQVKLSPSLNTSWEHEFEHSKQTFDDALFADDDELNKALEKAKSNSDEQTTNPTEPEKSAQTEDKTRATIEINFTQFLPANTKLGQITEPALDTPTAKYHLMAASQGVNGSQPGEVVQQASKSIFVLKKPTADRTQADETSLAATNPPHPLVTMIKTRAYNAKTQFDEYFGRSLPARDLALEFPTAALKPKKEFDSIVNTAGIKKLFSYKASSPLTVFKKADEQLGDISKCEISISHKLSLLDAYSTPLAENFRALITAFERKPSSPGGTKRIETSLYALGAIKHLINGYRQTYTQFYASSNYAYGPRRAKINRCAYRLIDLLCLEQRLSTSVQRALPSTSAKTMSKLYNALALYEPELLKQPSDSLALGKKCSINTLFTRYQVVRCFEMMTLSTTLHPIVYQYVNNNLSSLIIKSPSDLEQISGSWLQIQHQNGDTARLINALPIEFTKEFTNELTKEQQPQVLIWAQTFFNTLKKDYAECLATLGNTTHSHSSKALATFDIKNVLTVLSALNLCVHHLENNTTPASYAAYQPITQTAYSELSNVVGYINHYYQKLKEPPRAKGEPVKSPANKPKASINEWLCAMEDENTLHLQTTESKSNMHLDIGEVVLFVRISDEEEEHHQLARVTRMERVQKTKLNLVLEKLGNKIAHAAVTFISDTAKGLAEGKTVAGLLSQKEQAHYLITSTTQNTYTDQIVTVKLPDDLEATSSIDQLISLSQKLQVLSLK